MDRHIVGGPTSIQVDPYAVIVLRYRCVADAGCQLLASMPLNRDALTDLIAVETATGKLWMYPGAADGRFSMRVEIGSGWNGYTELTLGKFNRDAYDDLMALNTTTGQLLLYPGTATGGRFGAPTMIAIGG